MNRDWATEIREECSEAKVPFFFKQWGGINKKKAGRLLDGREWNDMPQEKFLI
jgi:protein gp37